MLSRAIDKTLRYVVGDINTAVIYSYLEKRGCRSNEIPAKPNEFSTELRKILGSGRGQILGAASILEETIVENLSAELQIYLDNPRLAQFADNIKKLREAYNDRNKNTQQIQCENSKVTIMNHVSAKSKEKTELFGSLIRKSSKEKGR
jgi:adenylate kinase family enzyme